MYCYYEFVNMSHLVVLEYLCVGLTPILLGLKYKDLLERTIETVGCPDAARVELETGGNPLLLVPISQIRLEIKSRDGWWFGRALGTDPPPQEGGGG